MEDTRPAGGNSAVAAYTLLNLSHFKCDVLAKNHRKYGFPFMIVSFELVVRVSNFC